MPRMSEAFDKATAVRLTDTEHLTPQRRMAQLLKGRLELLKEKKWKKHWLRFCYTRRKRELLDKMAAVTAQLNELEDTLENNVRRIVEIENIEKNNHIEYVRQKFKHTKDLVRQSQGLAADVFNAEVAKPRKEEQ